MIKIKMKWVLAMGSLGIGCCLFVACASKEKENPEKQKVVIQKRLAGIVQKVSQSSQFVLIRRYGRWKVREGEFVESRGNDGRIANLKPTGEKLGEYIAADICAGKVEVGDAIYIRKISDGEPTKPTHQSAANTSE